MLKTIPVAQRVLGESNVLTLKMRWNYAITLDDLREAVTTLEETTKTMRQVYGGAHPLTVGIETALRQARAALAAEAS